MTQLTTNLNLNSLKAFYYYQLFFTYAIGEIDKLLGGLLRKCYTSERYQKGNYHMNLNNKFLTLQLKKLESAQKEGNFPKIAKQYFKVGKNYKKQGNAQKEI